MFKINMAVRKKIKNKNKTSFFSRDIKFGNDMVAKLKLSVFIKFIFIVVLAISAVKLSSLWTELWPVKQVIVEGDSNYLQKNTLMEFVRNQNVVGMLAINLNDLQREAVKIDWIKAIEIKKVWPDKLVFIIQEHTPVAFMGSHVLTESGNVINVENSDMEFEHLPYLEFETDSLLTTTEYKNIWNNFNEISRDFSSLNLNPNKLIVDKLSNWEVYFDNGLQINLGRKNHYERVTRLIQSYPVIQNKKQLKRIDLRYHNGLAIQWWNNTDKELAANLFAKKES
jgi:cell division protein FtsQ